MIVLDVEMPRMDGLTFLRKLMRQHPLPVVLCTTQAERAVTALEMGAIEVIAKPDWNDAGRLADWSQNLLESIRNAARAGRLPIRDDRPAGAADPRHTADVDPAASSLLAARRRQRADHRRRGEHRRRAGLAAAARRASRRRARDRDRAAHAAGLHRGVRRSGWTTTRGSSSRSPRRRQHEPVRPGRALVIPGDMHGLIRRTGTGYRVELVDGPPVCRHRPSVEVLFRSAAQAAGPFAAGVIMTGMGDDGAGGLLEMREAGALTIAQNEATCIVFGMPREAIRRGAAKFVTSARLDRPDRHGLGRQRRLGTLALKRHAIEDGEAKASGLARSCRGPRLFIDPRTRLSRLNTNPS